MNTAVKETRPTRCFNNVPSVTMLPYLHVFLCAAPTVQLAGTPASAVSSAVGSAIRDIGSAGRFGPVDRGVSPAMPGLPDVSPTLALMPDMGTGSRLGQVREA